MLHFVSGELSRLDTPCLVFFPCENKALYQDPRIADMIEKIIQRTDFKAKSGEEIFLYDIEKIQARRILLVGLGKYEKINRETLRASAGKAVKHCIHKNIVSVTICPPDPEPMNLDAPSIHESLMEGAVLANYIFDQYKKEKKHKPLKQIGCYSPTPPHEKIRKLAAYVETVCRGAHLARQWVNMPPNDKRPDQFVKSIQEAAKKENLRISIFNEKALQKQGMAGILAVGSGSRSRPQMIILEYFPPSPAGSRRKLKTVSLVGKGVTFDSGGINLKPTDGLSDMKLDISGAAAVAAALITISRLKLNLRVVGVIPVVENMPSGDAVRPGDIIETFSGKTVEIANTDAEGRLILIDAMSYAEKIYKPDVMIDLATLTGACMVALGEKIAGLFSPDDELAEFILVSGEKIHERCWKMPLPEDYKDLLKSDVADIKNVGSSRYAGAVTAALFLKEFVKTARWAHIDIAGPAYNKKESDYCPAGGTGFGVRLIVDVIQQLSSFKRD